MESYSYTHFPPTLGTIHVALFTDVVNAAQLRTRIVNASTAQGVEGDSERDAVNFAFISAKLVTSRLHLQTAIYQSVLAQTQNALKTKTVHSEILWSLNPSNNITEALRRFGVSDTTTSLLLVRVGPPTDPELIEAQMRAVVAGRLVPLHSLSDITDWSAIMKYYKLNTDLAVVAVGKELIRQRQIVDELVTSFVAMKSVMS